MHKTTKDNSSADHLRSHSFPVFHDVKPVNDPEDDQVCQLFRPSYECDANQAAYRPAHLPLSECDPNQGEDATQKGRESYDRGVMAGQQDAHCLVQQELAPGIQGFVEAMNGLNAQLDHLTATSVHGVIQLALGIVGKIMGDNVSFDDETLIALNSEIRDILKRAYALSIRMNNDDFESLSSMLACSSEPSINGDGVELIADHQVPKGSLRHASGEPELSYDPILTKIFPVANTEPTP